MAVQTNVFGLLAKVCREMDTERMLALKIQLFMSTRLELRPIRQLQ